ncbi:oxidoreductase [Mangrovicoccus ximenensis]|uniref:oxidoreductase n=1 Tax=Mangrovicoccus ximenensis TaxID=1911570 RepID=UPI000D3A5C85|nr:oxidoreductase [Mangrovicoccus ximenensis]
MQFLNARSAAAWAAIALAAGSAAAGELAAPQGTPVLAIDGAISETNDGSRAVFDLAMLEALPAASFETSTSWTEGVQSFTGVTLAALMEAVGATGTGLRAAAINDYAVDIPAGDWVAGGPIVAYLRNGETMSIRDKGPLWIIYPFDGNPEYQSEVIYSRSIWQLDRITVTE